MPNYEFECKCPECKKTIEIFLKHIITDEEKNKTCECGKKMELILFSPHMKINDKEHGWYIQDRGFNNESPEYNYHKKINK